MMPVGYILAVLCGYLLGAIPSGLLMGRFYKGIDIRQYGSGRTGATNVLRTLGKGAATVVALADIGKGALAILLTRLIVTTLLRDPAAQTVFGFDATYVAEFLAGLAAMFGHKQSIWARLLTGHWSGGRSVLVGTGIVLAVAPLLLLVAAVPGMIAIIVSRYVSLGSIISSALAALLAVVWLLAGWLSPVLALLVIIAALLIIALHKDNIERLMAGKERKLGQSRHTA